MRVAFTSSSGAPATLNPAPLVPRNHICPTPYKRNKLWRKVANVVFGGGVTFTLSLTLRGLDNRPARQNYTALGDLYQVLKSVYPQPKVRDKL